MRSGWEIKAYCNLTARNENMVKNLIFGLNTKNKSI
jgi:hypothetical protein